MHAKVLEIWSYLPNGRCKSRTKFSDPTLHQIEMAVRELDRVSRPIMILWPTIEAKSQMFDEFSERLEVSGGNGLYWIACSHDGYLQRRFYNPDVGVQDVEIYGPLIEQGFGDQERHICRDVEKVVLATRYYAEYGGFAPTVTWEDGRRISS